MLGSIVLGRVDDIALEPGGLVSRVLSHVVLVMLRLSGGGAGIIGSSLLHSRSLQRDRELIVATVPAGLRSARGLHGLLVSILVRHALITVLSIHDRGELVTSNSAQGYLLSLVTRLLAEPYNKVFHGSPQ